MNLFKFLLARIVWDSTFSRGMLEQALSGLRESIMRVTSQLPCCMDSLKSAMVGVLTPWEWTNVKIQSFVCGGEGTGSVAPSLNPSSRILLRSKCLHSHRLLKANDTLIHKEAFLIAQQAHGEVTRHGFRCPFHIFGSCCSLPPLNSALYSFIFRSHNSTADTLNQLYKNLQFPHQD